jgi:hypothetical protein
MKHFYVFHLSKFLFLLLAIFYFSVPPSLGQTCDDCSHPRLALYDCDVQVLKPTTNPDSIIAWYNLFWPAAVARSYMHNNDPSKDCIYWKDGALVNAKELQNGTLTFGREYSNLPPQGSIYSSDYLIRSTVVASQGSYMFTLILETGPSREIVKSVQYPFQPTEVSANQVGQSAANDMMPLLQTIRQFEVNKRNADTKYAIRDLWKKGLPDEIIIKPEKSVVDTGETINLDITMTDCDGVPLGNRAITFIDTTIYWSNGGKEFPLAGTTGGEIIPHTATTDASGKVTVKFKAGSEPKAGNIIGWYPHLKPCGRADAFQGTALVQIKLPPPNLWLFDGYIENSYTMNQDTIKNWEIGGYNDQTESSAITEMITYGRITAIIENIADDPQNSFYYDPDAVDPYYISVSGAGWMDEFTKYRETINGSLYSADIRSDNVSGIATAGGLQILYSDDLYKDFNAGINIFAPGSYTGHRYYAYEEWSDYGGTYDNYGLSAEGACDALTDENCTITKTDSYYGISSSFDENTQEYTDYGTKYITQHKTVEAVLRPYNSVIGINEKEYNKLLPKNYFLSQNFPNPFNNTTVIKYSIPNEGLVTIKVYNILGEEVATLVNESKQAGDYQVTFNSDQLTSGVYLYKLNSGGFTQTKKMILLK